MLKGDGTANIYTLFHWQCQAMEDFYVSELEEEDQIFDLEKYLLIIMLKVQRMDHNEKRVEAGRVL